MTVNFGSITIIINIKFSTMIKEIGEGKRGN